MGGERVPQFKENPGQQSAFSGKPLGQMGALVTGPCRGGQGWRQGGRGEAVAAPQGGDPGSLGWGRGTSLGTFWRWPGGGLLPGYGVPPPPRGLCVRGQGRACLPGGGGGGSRVSRSQRGARKDGRLGTCCP